MRPTNSGFPHLETRAAIPVHELDSFLDVDRGRFLAVADRLIRGLDRARVRIEFERIPLRGIPGAEAEATPGEAALSTFRAEVSHIVPMDRGDELRLARRFDLVRRRYRRALAAAGLLPLRAPRSENREWFDAACDHEGVRGKPGCLFGSVPSETAEALHARRAEYDAARNAMVERALYLVLRLAPRFRGLGVPLPDLIQEGNASLFRAVEGFEWWRNVRFSTYATFWVNQAFLSLLYKTGRTVRVPAYIQKAMKRINAARVTSGKPNVPPEEIAQSAGLPVDFVKHVLSGNRYSLSLDREVGHEEGETHRFLDLLEDPHPGVDFEAIEDLRLPERLRETMEVLSPRERLVVELRYGLNGAPPHTLGQVGEILGVSLERVRQIQEVALHRMRGERGRRLLAHVLN
ncbi:MAG TPA: sigma-70 family RNA polymerase sigma factor [Planctomycetota bacterium]|jgi:RNA polymerase primary sigma factor|nr:sigma-70 family RNA polymerase sigma factor [Planctomycetota bacterium]